MFEFNLDGRTKITYVNRLQHYVNVTHRNNQEHFSSSTEFEVINQDINTEESQRKRQFLI